jgi:hypothetical protein
MIKKYLTSDIDFLVKEKIIDYFALTIFDEASNPKISTCTNMDWMTCYLQHCPNPPVQKHILQKKNGLLVWREGDYDSQTNAFITERNKICATKLIVTFVQTSNQSTVALSVGTNKKLDYIEKLYRERKTVFDDQFYKALTTN